MCGVVARHQILVLDMHDYSDFFHLWQKQAWGVPVTINVAGKGFSIIEDHNIWE